MRDGGACVHQTERGLHLAVAASFVAAAESAVVVDVVFAAVVECSAYTRPVLELALARLIIAAPEPALPSGDSKTS